MWDILGIQPTKEVRLIKKAYAIKLKENNPEVNPAGFQSLRNAYESALDYVDSAAIDESHEAVLSDTADSKLNSTNSGVDRFSEESKKTPSSFTSETGEGAEQKIWSQANSYASEFCDRLVKCFSIYQANQLTTEFLENDWFISIDARYIFERCLINQVAEKEQDFNEEQLAVLIKNFNWADHNHILWEQEHYAMMSVWSAYQERFKVPEELLHKKENPTYDKTALLIIFIVIAISSFYSFLYAKHKEREMIQYNQYKEITSRQRPFVNNHKKLIIEPGASMSDTVKSPAPPSFIEDAAPYSKSFHKLDQNIKLHMDKDSN